MTISELNAEFEAKAKNMYFDVDELHAGRYKSIKTARGWTKYLSKRMAA